MPPRYSYWTILAGGLPTAFRAAEREDLLPTFNRIRDKHSDAEMKWFARGRLWDSPEAAQDDLERVRERRDRDWRPGGAHRDPRKTFKDARRGGKREGQNAKRDGKRPERPSGPASTTKDRATPASRDTLQAELQRGRERGRDWRPSGAPRDPRKTFKDAKPGGYREGQTAKRDGKHPQRPTGPASTSKDRATPASRAASASRDAFRRETKPRGPRPENRSVGRADRRGEGPPRKRQR